MNKIKTSCIILCLIFFYACNEDEIKFESKVEKLEIVTFAVKGESVFDSIQSVLNFKIKSGGYLTSNEKKNLYYADTSNKENLLNFAIALYQEKQFNKSNQLLNKLLDIDSTSKLEVLFQKAILWDKVPNNDSTLSYLNKCISISPTTSMLYYYRSVFYDNSLLFNLAIKDINLAIKYSPKNEDYIIFRGYIKIELEDYQGAFRDLKKTPLTMQNNPLFYTNRAILAFKMNSFQDCIEQASKSIKLDSTIPKNYTLRGGAYIMLGDNGKGLNDYKKASELDDIEGHKAYVESLEYLKTHKQI